VVRARRFLPPTLRFEQAAQQAAAASVLGRRFQDEPCRSHLLLAQDVGGTLRRKPLL
jgi:hypothetical protein